MIQLAIGLLGAAVGIVLMLSDMWAQGLAIALAAVLGPPLFRNPDLMAVATLALAPIQVDLGGNITPVKAWAPLALAAAAFQSARTGEWRVPPASLMVGFGAFAMWALVSETNAMSIDPVVLVLTMGSTLVQIVLLWRAALSPGGLRRIAVAYTLFTIALAISMPLMPTVGFSTEELGVRYSGLCNEPNWSGESAARLLPLAIALLLDGANSKSLRVLGGIGAASALYSLFASASRGGTLAMIGGMAFFVIALADNMRNALRSLALLAVTAAALLYLAPASFSYRVLGSFGYGEYAGEEFGDITSGRVAVNSMAVEAFVEAPWLGLGAAGWQIRNLYLTGARTAIHNGPLSGLVAFGLPAVAAYAATVVSALIAVLRALPRSGSLRVYVAAIAAHLVSVQISSQTLTDIVRNLVWVAPGLALAAAAVVKEAREHDQLAAAVAAAPGPAAADRLGVRPDFAGHRAFDTAVKNP